MAQNPNGPWKVNNYHDWQVPALAALSSRTVAHLSIEFLYINGDKPHVVFNLKANATRQDPNPHYKGVRLSMEWDGGADFDIGTFEITPLPYVESSRRAHGAFDFPLLKTNLTIKDWCQIMRGRYQGLPAQHTSDLTNFRFVEAPGGIIDGCRDFICQSFMRLYDIGMVQGHGGGLGAGSSYKNFHLIPRHDELGTGDHYWFFDIIDKNFVKENAGTPNQRIKITPAPMYRGIFLTPSFTRKEVFVVNRRYAYRLNYVAQRQPAQVYPRNDPSRPPRNGGGGNSGAGGRPRQGRPGQPPAAASNTGVWRGGAGPMGFTGGPAGYQLHKGGKQALAPAKPFGKQPLAPTNPGIGLAPEKHIGSRPATTLPERTKVSPAPTKAPAPMKAPVSKAHGAQVKPIR